MLERGLFQTVADEENERGETNMKKNKITIYPGSRRAAECRLAALVVIGRLDHERPTELEIYGCPPCREYPDGLIGLAELERMKRPDKLDPVPEVELRMLPYGFGKLLGSE